MSKLLFLDIEATNLNASFGTTLCFGYQWLGEKKPKVISIRDYPKYEKDPTDDSMLMKDIKKLLLEADIWCGWYSKRYDIPFLQTRMLYANLGALPSTPHIDLWWTAKSKLKMHSNRLAAVTEFFDLGAKTPVLGRQWVRAMAGHKPSLTYIERHCLKDIEVLAKAYDLMKPIVNAHPNAALLDNRPGCPTCGSDSLQKRGSATTRTKKYTRYQCTACGAWTRDTKVLETARLV